VSSTSERLTAAQGDADVHAARNNGHHLMRLTEKPQQGAGLGGLALLNAIAQSESLSRIGCDGSVERRMSNHDTALVPRSRSQEDGGSAQRYPRIATDR
jgi:hypothetical protein